MTEFLASVEESLDHGQTFKIKKWGIFRFNLMGYVNNSLKCKNNYQSLSRFVEPCFEL